MRIAIFHNLGAGGAKRQLVEQARALTARGHHLDVFTTAAGEDASEYLPLAPVCASIKVYGDANAGGSVVGNHSAAGDRGRLRRLANTSIAGRALLEAAWVQKQNIALNELSRRHGAIARDIDEGSYDAAYICQCRRLLAPDVLRFLRKTPILFCCNDTLRAAYEWNAAPHPEYDATPDKRLRHKRRGRYFSPALLTFDAREERRFVANARHAHLTLANSLYTRERLLGVAGIDARVNYPGVDSIFYCPDPNVPRDSRLVVSVGALLPTKRHELVLRAVATLPRPKRPRVEILGYESRHGAAGLGPEGRRLCALSSELGVDLTLHKEVTDEAVRDAYRRAGAVAFAPYLEPLGIVPLEAGACGAAVVGAAEAGIRETIRAGETGLLVDTLEPAVFGAALSRVLENPEEARRMGEAGRAVVERDWTWAQSTDRLETALIDTIARRQKATAATP